MYLTQNNRYLNIYTLVWKHRSWDILYKSFFFLFFLKGGVKTSHSSFYLFIYLWLCWVFFSVRGPSLVAASGATLHHSARASHHRGLSCCGAQAQQSWLTGPAAPRHVGSSQTRARARVPCIGRQTLNHCATRESLSYINLAQKVRKLIC